MQDPRARALEQLFFAEWRCTLYGILREQKKSARVQAKRRRSRQRSNCLGCQGCLVYFLVLNLLCLPGRPMLQHGIEHRQQFMHTRGESDFFDFPCSE